jgi:putative FmdB family regulatory protein
MPTYSYKCGNCYLEFDVVQKMVDEPIKKCPQCKFLKVKKIIQPTTVIFKGNNWNDKKR